MLCSCSVFVVVGGAAVGVVVGGVRLVVRLCG